MAAAWANVLGVDESKVAFRLGDVVHLLEKLHHVAKTERDFRLVNAEYVGPRRRHRKVARLARVLVQESMKSSSRILVLGQGVKRLHAGQPGSYAWLTRSATRNSGRAWRGR